MSGNNSLNLFWNLRKIKEKFESVDSNSWPLRLLLRCSWAYDKFITTLCTPVTSRNKINNAYKSHTDLLYDRKTGTKSIFNEIFLQEKVSTLNNRFQALVLILWDLVTYCIIRFISLSSSVPIWGNKNKMKRTNQMPWAA